MIVPKRASPRPRARPVKRGRASTGTSSAPRSPSVSIFVSALSRESGRRTWLFQEHRSPIVGSSPRRVYHFVRTMLIPGRSPASPYDNLLASTTTPTYLTAADAPSRAWTGGSRCTAACRRTGKPHNTPSARRHYEARSPSSGATSPSLVMPCGRSAGAARGCATHWTRRRRRLGRRRRPGRRRSRELLRRCWG